MTEFEVKALASSVAADGVSLFGTGFFMGFVCSFCFLAPITLCMYLRGLK